MNTQPQHQDSVSDEPSIDFSIEELFAVAELLQLHGIPGLGAEPLAFLDSAVHEVVLESARRALVARRFVAPAEDGSYEIMRPVAQMVSNVARAGIQVRAVFEAEGAVETRCFAAEPELALEHSVVFGAVQRLTPFRTEQLLARILEFCGIEARPAIECQAFNVTEAALTACVGRLEAEDREGGVTALTSAGVPEATASAFVVALEHRVSSASVSILHRPQANEISGGELTWLDAGEYGLWLTPILAGAEINDSGDEVEPVPITIEPTTAKWIAEELLSYLPGA